MLKTDIKDDGERKDQLKQMSGYTTDDTTTTTTKAITLSKNSFA